MLALTAYDNHANVAFEHFDRAVNVLFVLETGATLKWISPLCLSTGVLL